MAANARMCWRIAENAWLCTVSPLSAAQCHPKGANGRAYLWDPGNVCGDVVNREHVEKGQECWQGARNAFRDVRRPADTAGAAECI